MPTIYVTAPPDAAADLARTVVDERLAACVNRFDCESVYRWDGEVIDEEEVILLAKTTADRAPALIERFAELHPYDVPCIEEFDQTAMDGPFRDWIEASVQSTG